MDRMISAHQAPGNNQYCADKPIRGGFVTLGTEPEGFAEAPDGTLVHFIDLDLHAGALHTEVSDPVVLIHWT